jgi:aminoglycoside 3-N-acetyltransferase
MREVTKEQVINALDAIGISNGDSLLVHSAIQFLGPPVGDVGIYYEALKSIIGPAGTLVVPTFNFDFPRSLEFDPLATPSKGMGAFSEYIRQHPDSKRTLHPMQSVACSGKYADDLAGRDTPSAFDNGSAYDRMFELDFKLLLLGANVQSVSMLHYSEQRARVPYRYWKEFSGQIHTPSGWENRTYLMYVRDMEIDPKLSLKAVQRYMEENSTWRSTELNYGLLCSCRLVDFTDAVDHFLAEDPWSLVTNRPPIS